tara:strand:- start:1366 stop:2643 length:1278 start_codon:yes stop_codon:yes gene_type:complete
MDLLKYVKESFWILFGQVFSILGSLVLIKILTNYLNPNQYGILSLVLSFEVGINQILMGGLIAGTSRYYPVAKEKKDLINFFKDTKKIFLVSTIIIIALGIITFFINYFFYNSSYHILILCVIIFSIFSSGNSVLTGIQNAARKRKISAIQRLLDVWVKISIIIILLNNFEASTESVLIAYLISSLSVFIVSYWLIQKLIVKEKSRVNNNNNWLYNIFMYSWPFSLWGIFTWLQQISDRWALEIFNSSYNVGLYSVLNQLGYVPMVLVTNFGITFLNPIIFEKYGDGSDPNRRANVNRLIWRITLFSLFFVIIVFLLLLSLHNNIFEIFVSKKYWSVSYLLPWFALSGGIFSTAQFLSTKVHADRITKRLINIKISTSIIGIGLSMYFAKVRGLSGIAISSNIFSFLYFIWITIIVFNLIKKENE